MPVRAGSSAANALEIYLMNALAGIAPSSASQQAGPKPGDPEADTANVVPEVIVGAVGALRQTAASDPTVVVQVQDLGISPGVTLGGVLRDIRLTQVTGRPGVAAIIRDVNAARLSRPVQPGTAVPRFGVHRSNYDQGNESSGVFVGATENFARWPGPSSQVALIAGTALETPCFVESPDGILLLGFLIDFGSNVFGLRVKRYDPAQDTDLVTVTSIANLRTTLGNANLIPTAVTATVFQQNVYFFVAWQHQSQSVGGFYALRLDAAGLVPTPTPAVSVPIPAVPDGGIAATATAGGVVVAVGVVGTGLSGTGVQRRSIQVAHSVDMRTWGDDPATAAAGLVALGDFNMLPNTANAQPNAVHFLDNVTGFAVGSDGRIFRSDDGGRSWVEQTSPASAGQLVGGNVNFISLNAVRTISTNIAYACGNRSLILQTVDGGTTWKVVRYGGGALDVFQASAVASGLTVTGKSINLMALTGAAGGNGWACGDGVVLYTADDGATWTEIIDYGHGSFFTIDCAGGTTNLQLGGSDTLPPTGSSYGGPQITQIANPTTPKIVGSSDLTYTYLPGIDIVTSLVRLGPTQSYACAKRRGAADIFAWNGTSWSRTGASIPLNDLSVGDAIYARDGTPDFVFVLTNNRLYRSIDAGVTFVAQMLPAQLNAAALWFFDVDTVSAVGLGGFAFASSLLSNRVFPALLTNAAGDVLLATCNLSRGRNEIFYSSDQGRSFPDIVDAQIASVLATTVDLSAIRPFPPRPALAVDDFGAILCVAGSGRGKGQGPPTPTIAVGSHTPGVAAGDWEWVTTLHNTTTGDETGPSAPVRAHFAGGNNEVTLTFLNPGTGYATRIYRRNLNASVQEYYYHPTPGEVAGTGGGGFQTYIDRLDDSLMDKGDWAPEVGSGGRVSLDGGRTWISRTDPALALPLGAFPAGDSLTSETDVNGYGTAIAYRSRLWRAANGSGGLGMYVARDFQPATTGAPTHYVPITGKPQWLGVDDARVIIMGQPAPGDQWTVAPDYDYAARFLAVESPSAEWYRGRTDANVGADAEISLIWDRGAGHYWEVSAFGLFGTNFQQVIVGLSLPSNDASYTEVTVTQVVDSGTALAPATSVASNVIIDSSKTWVPHQFIAGLRQYYLKQTLPDSTVRVFRILDSGPNAIVIDGSVTLDGTPRAYQIFSDRIYVNLGTLGLATRFGRNVRIRIPGTQRTAEGYRKMGTVVAGVHVDYRPLLGTERRHRFSAGFGWQPITNTIETVGLSGVSSIEHFGRTGQQWQLPYEQEQYWDRDMKLNGLLPKMRQAFCLVFDGSDAQTAELVSLTDAPQFANTAGDRYNSQYVLKEKV